MTKEMYLYNGLTVLTGGQENTSFIKDLKEVLSKNEGINNSTVCGFEDSAEHPNYSDGNISSIFNSLTDVASQNSVGAIMFTIDCSEDTEETAMAIKQEMKQEIEYFSSVGYTIYAMMVIGETESVAEEERCIDISDLASTFTLNLNIV